MYIHIYIYIYTYTDCSCKSCVVLKQGLCNDFSIFFHGRLGPGQRFQIWGGFGARASGLPILPFRLRSPKFSIGFEVLPVKWESGEHEGSISEEACGEICCFSSS